MFDDWLGGGGGGGGGLDRKDVAGLPVVVRLIPNSWSAKRTLESARGRY